MPAREARRHKRWTGSEREAGGPRRGRVTARICASRRYRGRVCSEDDQCHNHAGYFCAGDAGWWLSGGEGTGAAAIRCGRPAVAGPHRSLAPPSHRASRFRGPRFLHSRLAHPHSFLVRAPVSASVARFCTALQDNYRTTATITTIKYLRAAHSSHLGAARGPVLNDLPPSSGTPIVTCRQHLFSAIAQPRCALQSIPAAVTV